MTDPTPITAAPTYYRRRPLFATKTFDVTTEGDGFTALEVTYRLNLSYAELDAIPFGREVTTQEAWQALAPYITGWNIGTLDPDTGEPVPVPPPAEAGWEVCRHLDALETAWLLNTIKFAYLATPKGEEERSKSSAESVSTPKTESDNDSASETSSSETSPATGSTTSPGISDQ